MSKSKSKGRAAREPEIDQSDREYIAEKMRGSAQSGEASALRNYDFKINFKCKNEKQKAFQNLLKDDSKQIVAAIGSAGSGKSIVSLAYALNAVKAGGTGRYKHVVCLVPTCPAGNMNIGFLKGTLDEKIEPYLEADTNTMEKILRLSGNYSVKSTVAGLVANGVVQYELVNFSRGKTFDDSLILVNEAENYSREEMLLILTRLGENSKLVLTGDLEQCDRQDILRSGRKSGLEFACERLASLKEFAMIEFLPEDVVRNPLITKILDAWKDAPAPSPEQPAGKKARSRGKSGGGKDGAASVESVVVGKKNS